LLLGIFGLEDLVGFGCMADYLDLDGLGFFGPHTEVRAFPTAYPEPTCPKIVDLVNNIHTGSNN
jgi:hypothetical protein